MVTTDTLTAEETWNHTYIDLSSAFSSVLGPSQNGEDGLLDALFKICTPKNKWAVECGATDGYNLSNTWWLLTKKKWKGVLIENNEQYYSRLDRSLKKYILLLQNNTQNYNLVDTYKGYPKAHTVFETVKKDNLNDILSDFSIPKNFDFLSIDIDSWDYDVWKNLKYEPNVVCIENDPFEHDFSVISTTPAVRPDGRVGGHSVGKLKRLAKRKGYVYLCTKQCNTFFIKPEFARPLLRKEKQL